MNNSAPDISTILISEEEIKQKLASIFVDSIIVDSNLRILVVSQNVLDFLEFSKDELRDKSINYLAHDYELKSLLEQQLIKGFFEEILVSVSTKGGRKLQLAISGFYLGLISEINGYVVLKVRNIDEVRMISEKLEAKQAELDKFIYRTAHDLRGPLATIKGLVNLLKMKSFDAETNQIVEFIDTHAEKLDEKLFKLLYMAETDYEHAASRNCLQIDVLENSLRHTLQQNCHLDSLTLRCLSPQLEFKDVNEQLVTSLLNNVLLYFLCLPKVITGSHIALYFSIDNEGLKIKIKADGFVVSDALRDAIRSNTSLYTDMLNYPYLMNFFAAQKVAARLQASFKVVFFTHSLQEISLLIPVATQPQLSMF